MKSICFYLPQYHPDAENDKWWGNGFTDWHNVVRARSRFKGHHQPHIPADLGFYDLRLEQTRRDQASLARKYGIAGFCYYHYWFNGKRLLAQPLDGILASGQPDFPFCLCWANENWTRAWDGLEKQVLVRQNYTAEDAAAHIAWLTPVFADKRYIRIDHKPLFLIYRPDQIPDVSTMLARWRQAVRGHDVDDLYLCAVKNGSVALTEAELLAQGFDAVVDFQPNRDDFPEPKSLKPWLYRQLKKWLPDDLYQRIKLSVSAYKLVDYEMMAKGLIAKDWPSDYRKFPCVFPSWDNSARRQSATIIQNTDPEIYRQCFETALIKVQGYPESERIVFINAWNEWAEGCHLEPDTKLKHAFLQATRAALKPYAE